MEWNTQRILYIAARHKYHMVFKILSKKNIFGSLVLSIPQTTLPNYAETFVNKLVLACRLRLMRYRLNRCFRLPLLLYYHFISFVVNLYPCQNFPLFYICVQVYKYTSSLFNSVYLTIYLLFFILLSIYLSLSLSSLVILDFYL